MNRRNKLIALSAAIVGTAALGTGIARAGGGDDAETPIPATELGEASLAALEHVGEGRVTETEIGDEESLYEVEVTLDDGTQIDVQLDEAFNVVSDKVDDDSADDQD